MNLNLSLPSAMIKKKREQLLQLSMIMHESFDGRVFFINIGNPDRAI